METKVDPIQEIDVERSLDTEPYNPFKGLSDSIPVDVLDLPKLTLEQLKEKSEKFDLKSPELMVMHSKSYKDKFEQKVRDAKKSSNKIDLNYAQEALQVPFSNEVMRFMLAGINHKKLTEPYSNATYTPNQEVFIEQVKREGGVRLFQDLRQQILTGHINILHRATKFIGLKNTKVLSSTSFSSINDFLRDKTDRQNALIRIQSAASIQRHGIEQGLQAYFDKVLTSQVDKRTELMIWQKNNYYSIQEYGHGLGYNLNEHIRSDVSQIANDLAKRFANQIFYMYPIGEN